MSTFSDMHPGLLIDATGTVKILRNNDVILQSVKTIIATVTGERVRNPIGNRFVRLLFQPMEEDLADQVRDELRDAIQKYEPRVEILGFAVTPNYDGNYYDAVLRLRVRSTQSVEVLRTRIRSFSTN